MYLAFTAKVYTGVGLKVTSFSVLELVELRWLYSQEFRKEKHSHGLTHFFLERFVFDIVVLISGIHYFFLD